jgi:hypothetical protein
MALGLFKKKGKQTDCADDGGGAKCKPMGGARSGGYQSEAYKPINIKRMSKKESEQADKEWRVRRIMLKAKKLTPENSTAPGVRGSKKGSQYFFGKNINESDV